MMPEHSICPFSKPVIGNWCQCEHANLSERCSGKMGCNKGTQQLQQCYHLVDLLKENSRFVLALSADASTLTHAQLMKIRCGGIAGFHRYLEMTEDIPDIQKILQRLETVYPDLSLFPFNEIMPDIKQFKHRKQR